MTAQTTWGVKGGTGFSSITVYGADSSSYRVKLTYLGGIYVNRKFTSHTGMTGELIYLNKGAKANPSVHLHYISAPILFNYYFADGRLRFEGGGGTWLFDLRTNKAWLSRLFLVKRF